jgi:hypothetical protein
MEINNFTSITPTIRSCPNCGSILEITTNPNDLVTAITCAACQETFWIDKQGATMRLFTPALWEETLLLFKMEEFTEKHKYYV